MITSLLIPPNGEPHTQPLPPDDARVLSRLIGGTFEAVYGTTSTDLRVVFYSHGDAIAAGLPINLLATALWHRLNADAGRNCLRGTVIVVGGEGPSDADAPVLVSRMARTLHRSLAARC